MAVSLVVCQHVLPAVPYSRRQADDARDVAGSSGGTVDGTGTAVEALLVGRFPAQLRNLLLKPPTELAEAKVKFVQTLTNLQYCTPESSMKENLLAMDKLPQRLRKGLSHYGCLPPAEAADMGGGSSGNTPPLGGGEPTVAWRDPGNAFYETYLEVFLHVHNNLYQPDAPIHLAKYSAVKGKQRRRERAGDILEGMLGGALLGAELMSPGNYEDVRWALAYKSDPASQKDDLLNFGTRLITSLVAFEVLMQVRGYTHAAGAWWDWDARREAINIFSECQAEFEKVFRWTCEGFAVEYKGDDPTRRRSVAGAERHRARDRQRALARRGAKRGGAGTTTADTPPLGGGAAASEELVAATASSHAAGAGVPTADTPPLGGGTAASASAAPTAGAASSHAAGAASSSAAVGVSFEERKALAKKRLAPTSSEEGSASDWD